MKDKQKITNQDPGVTNLDSIPNNESAERIDYMNTETGSEKSGPGNNLRTENQTDNTRERNAPKEEPEA